MAEIVAVVHLKLLGWKIYLKKSASYTQINTEVLFIFIRNLT